MYSRIPVEERFWSHVNKNGPVPVDRPDLGPCWIWTAKGRDGNGYAAIAIDYLPTRSVLVKVHRFSYELHKGPIPEGLTIDHLCFVRDCVNPDHLEAVTLAVNVLRARNGVSAMAARATHCPKGHPYDLLNTQRTRTGFRVCAECNRQGARAWRVKAAAAGAPKDDKGRHRSATTDAARPVMVQQAAAR